MTSDHSIQLLEKEEWLEVWHGIKPKLKTPDGIRALLRHVVPRIGAIVVRSAGQYPWRADARSAGKWKTGIRAEDLEKIRVKRPMSEAVHRLRGSCY